VKERGVAGWGNPFAINQRDVWRDPTSVGAIGTTTRPSTSSAQSVQRRRAGRVRPFHPISFVFTRGYDPRGGILRFIMMEIRPRPDVARTHHNSQRREVRILSLPLSLSLSSQPAVLWTALFTFLARLVEAGNGFPNVGKPLASENVEED